MEKLADNILPELNERAGSLYPAYFAEYEKKINRCCFSICYSVLKDLGLLNRQGESFTRDNLIQDKNISAHGHYLLKQILFILEEEGVLIRQDNTYTLVKQSDPESPAEMLVALTREFPEEGAAFQWLARAYEGIPDILTGKVYAEDILFPWGSFELVEEVYFSSRVYSFFPLMTGTAVKLLVEKQRRERISILEIGAGTGNGTDEVLEGVKERCSRYLYTDVMRSMLKKAKRKYAAFPFMEYQLYDLNRDPVDQGLAGNSFDLIIAVNVLHATRNSRQSLAWLRQLLKEQGWLVLSEIAPPRESVYRYMELTFGLLASYYSYEDEETRPRAPILRPEQWAEILREEGFREVIPAPSEGTPTFERGGLILGRK